MDIKEVLLKRIDIKGLLVEDLMEGIIKSELDKLVAKTDNTLDDALVAMIYPEMVKAVEAFIDEKLMEALAK